MHGCTHKLHNRWYSAAEAYRVQYQPNYEPWYVVERYASLQYDVRFRGYGWNKVQQVRVATIS